MPDQLDEAVMRSGRFDKKIELELPTFQERRDLLQFYLKRVKHNNLINIDSISSVTIGFSPADIKNLINVAALEAVRRSKPAVGDEELALAYDKIAIGSVGSDSNYILRRDREKVALHQAGHALCAALN